MVTLHGALSWVTGKGLHSVASRSSDFGGSRLEKVHWSPLSPGREQRDARRGQRQKLEIAKNGSGNCGRPVAAARASVPGRGNDKPMRKADFLRVEDVSFRPPGTQVDLLNKVSMSLPERSLGLLYGPSGSGKTTLLQILGGLATPTEGSIYLGKDGSDSSKSPAGPLSLSARVGIVFQFPERYFLTDTIVEELLFGYSRQSQDFQFRNMMTLRLQTAIIAVGLSGMPLDMNPRALSDGYKRRLALAIQLVRMPDIMLLDEPLAGLDWMARANVAKLLTALKRDKTLIVVSHDLSELAGLVDKSWQMEMGGYLTERQLPKESEI